MLLSIAFEGFIIDRRAAGYSPSTIRHYHDHFKQLRLMIGDPEVSNITTSDLNKFLVFLRTDYRPNNHHNKPLSDKSINNVWCSLRAFFRWTHTEQLTISNVALPIKKPKFQAPEVQPLTEQEIKKMIAATRKIETKNNRVWARRTALRDETIMLIFLDTGLRAGELARLTVADVNLENGEVFVIPYGRGRKTKSRHVYIGRATRRLLWRCLSMRQTFPADPLFLTNQDRPMHKNNIYKMFEDIARRAGVVKFHPHRFRHTFAKQFLMNGGDPFTLQRLLGHSTLDMVKRYVAIANADAAKVHQTASPVDRWHL